MSMQTDQGTSEAAARRLRHILLVDNDPHHLFYASVLLQRFGYRVRTAANAVEALDMIRKSLPLLVITRLEMPLISGRELLRRIRNDEHLRHIPVIAMGDAGSNEAGFAACLKDPVVAEDLFQSVQAATEPVPREHIRIKTRLPVAINNVMAECVDDESIAVLSEHGMYITTGTIHQVNSSLAVRFSVGGRTISADAVVIYTHDDNEGLSNGPGMGIKFLKMFPQDREHLRSFIRSQVESGIRPDR